VISVCCRSRLTNLRECKCVQICDWIGDCARECSEVNVLKSCSEVNVLKSCSEVNVVSSCRSVVLSSLSFLFFLDVRFVKSVFGFSFLIF
jgi:hypothetical protein